MIKDLNIKRNQSIHFSNILIIRVSIYICIMKRAIALLIAIPLLIPQAQAQEQEGPLCHLEVYDLDSGSHSVVQSFPFRIEAPNWTPDGKWLIINKEGRLWKIAPDGSTDLLPVDTGRLDKCNNDNVVTADGKWLGISSNDPDNDADYNSYVFVIPFGDDVAERRVTPLGPSYLHGISPDGKKAAYCAFRDDGKIQDVFVIPVKGGKEKRLTDAPGLDDGPEYSPDGKAIWFNSVRTGRMQIWRMTSRGRKETQMTFDEDMNSWFPHISPDGSKVVYIAYHDYETAPGDHPANKNVLLRMIPSGGGTPKILVDFYGGQGSLNVNSWSPDSRRFAYVSYEK